VRLWPIWPGPARVPRTVRRPGHSHVYLLLLLLLLLLLPQTDEEREHRLQRQFIRRELEEIFRRLIDMENPRLACNPVTSSNNCHAMPPPPPPHLSSPHHPPVRMDADAMYPLTPTLTSSIGMPPHITASFYRPPAPLCAAETTLRRAHHSNS
jgi:hypothetical protein